MIHPACEFGDLLHISIHCIGNHIIEPVDCFAGLKIDVRILGQSPGNRLFRVECIVPESFQCIYVHQFGQFVLIRSFYLLDLVGSTEPVKEMEERKSGFDGGKVGHSGQVHHFLYTSSGYHGKTRLADRHYITVVSEDGECLCCQTPCRYVEYPGEKFS